MPSFKSEKDKPFSDWPNIGEILVDSKGRRRLTVTEINIRDRHGRNVVGKLDDGQLYACDVTVLLAVWARLN
jgi:hypothetical protein